MASRDLTSVFIERRKASSLRKRSKGGVGNGVSSSSMKPFSISQKLSGGGGGDDHLLIEV